MSPLPEKSRHVASAGRSPASIFAADSSCIPGITCEEVSKVMPMEA